MNNKNTISKSLNLLDAGHLPSGSYRGGIEPLWHRNRRCPMTHVRACVKSEPYPCFGRRKGYEMRKIPHRFDRCQWKLAAPIPKPKPGGRPQSVDRREILNAVFYLVRGGIQWRMLPHDFPHGERSITTIGNGVAMARGRRSRTPCGPRSGTRPAGQKPQRRHHRQPNREDDRDGRPPRLRRWQANQGT